MVTSNKSESKEKQIVLPDVSLCSIVRDEKMNPAGGIERFVESHVPFVEEAVIVDTGSLDGTREILEELQGKYSNLKIYDTKFNGFADARNYSLSKVKTKYALVLDADELITHERPSNDWEIIYDDMKRLDKKYDLSALALTLEFKHILPSGKEKRNVPCWNGRLFEKENAKFNCSLFEELEIEGGDYFQTSATIFHFLPNRNNLEDKMDFWYKEGDGRKFRKHINKNIAPSQIEWFSKWKKYNPKRDKYE